MKKAFIITIAAFAASPAFAQNRCLDESCTIVALLPATQAGGQTTVDPSKPIHYGTWGFDTAGMDKSVKPGDDWFNFVNGTWAKNTQIPPDRTSWGGFALLRDVSDARLHTMVQRYKIDDPDADRAKVATVYKAYMDEPGVERAGAAPLKPYLDRITKAASKTDMARVMGQSLGGFGASFFAPGVSDDAKRPDVYSLYLRQSGLGLGDRELYVDPKFKPQVDRYRQYVGADARARRMAECGRRGREGRRHGDARRRGALDARREPRSRQDLQPDDDRGAREAGAGLPVEGVLEAAGIDEGRTRDRRARTPRSRRSRRSSPTRVSRR